MLTLSPTGPEPSASVPFRVFKDVLEDVGSGRDILGRSTYPKGFMYPNSIYLSLKVVSILVLWGQSI